VLRIHHFVTFNADFISFFEKNVDVVKIFYVFFADAKIFVFLCDREYIFLSKVIKRLLLFRADLILTERLFMRS